MNLDQIDCLLENAVTAKNNSHTKWAKNYWQTVIAALIRRTNCLTK